MSPPVAAQQPREWLWLLALLVMIRVFGLNNGTDDTPVLLHVDPHADPTAARRELVAAAAQKLAEQQTVRPKMREEKR